MSQEAETSQPLHQGQPRASDGRFLPKKKGGKTVAVRVYGDPEDMDWFAGLDDPVDRGRVVKEARKNG